MKLEKAIEILEQNQAWRSGKHNEYFYDPDTLHEAIDVVLAKVKKNIRLKAKKDIAMEIRRIRIERNFTQVYVAKQIGISQPEYSKIENAYRKKSNLELLDKLCQLFEVPMNEFLQ